MSEPGNRGNRIVLLIFIVLGLITIGATLVSNFNMWSWYDKVEAEQGITPEQATPIED